jgi:phage major head subunit gpT-like protein
MRKWLGARQIKNLGVGGYRLENDDTELTISVPRNAVDDNQLGTYGPLFQEMGRMAKVFPDIVLASVMANGWDNAAAVMNDGSYFFATDHPYTTTAGAAATQANTDAGSGTPWFLMDLSRALKPFIYQVRKEPEFVKLDRAEDKNVFFDKEFIYGVDGRMACGYGMYQFVWGSKQTLNASNYATAYAALENMKNDMGVPLGITPTHLVIPPSLRANAAAIVNMDRDDAGAANIWYKTSEMLVWHYLGLTPSE